MKKILLFVLGLICVVSLSACEFNVGTATDDQLDNDESFDGDGVNNDLDETGSLQDGQTMTDIDLDDKYKELGYQKTSLTIDDLNVIDDMFFPSSYTYTVCDLDVGADYECDESVEEYIYPEDIDHNLLIPIYSSVSNKIVESSLIENGLIYTIVDVKLIDGSDASIVYINDPVTLKYLEAIVNQGSQYTTYIFKYEDD